MQRLNRSTTSAPKGTAFFLFLGLAVVPFSLRAVGLQVTFSPSLSAAADAWQQIADVFGAGYQPVREFVSSPPNYTDGEPLRAVDTAACAGREVACVGDAEEFSVTAADVSQAHAPKTAAVRACPKLALRARATSLVAATPAVAGPVVRNGFQKQIQALESLGAMNLDILTHTEPLKNEELVKNIQRRIVERSLATPQNFMMLVRVKSLVVPSATKAPQCKVRAALDSVRRIERERAILTTLSSANPDNCEM